MERGSGDAQPSVDNLRQAGPPACAMHRITRLRTWNFFCFLKEPFSLASFILFSEWMRMNISIVFSTRCAPTPPWFVVVVFYSSQFRSFPFFYTCFGREWIVWSEYQVASMCTTNLLLVNWARYKQPGRAGPTGPGVYRVCIYFFCFPRSFQIEISVVGWFTTCAATEHAQSSLGGLSLSLFPYLLFLAVCIFFWFWLSICYPTEAYLNLYHHYTVVLFVRSRLIRFRIARALDYCAQGKSDEEKVKRLSWQDCSGLPSSFLFSQTLGKCLLFSLTQCPPLLLLLSPCLVFSNISTLVSLSFSHTHTNRKRERKSIFGGLFRTARRNQRRPQKSWQMPRFSRSTVCSYHSFALPYICPYARWPGQTLHAFIWFLHLLSLMPISLRYKEKGNYSATRSTLDWVGESWSDFSIGSWFEFFHASSTWPVTIHSQLEERLDLSTR